MNHRQATHLFCTVLGFCEGNHPAARRRLGFILISGFADEAPGGVGWTARRRVAISPVLGFLGFWDKSNRGKRQGGTVKGDNVNQQ